MIFTWIKNGKPDVSMSLNGSLAGLVAVTAGCDVVDALGSCIIGAVAGILVVVAVEFIDIKLKVDDPVGAVAVHCVNGMWGTIAVGLFDTQNGLFYGGGAKQLGLQLLGVVSVAAWTAVTMTVVFTIIKKQSVCVFREKRKSKALMQQSIICRLHMRTLCPLLLMQRMFRQRFPLQRLRLKRQFPWNLTQHLRMRAASLRMWL